MKPLTKKIKLATLKTLYLCIMFDPLGYYDPYDPYEHVRVYYALITDAVKKGQTCNMAIRHSNYVLLIDGEKYER